jgi:hypothetical protein
MDEEKENEINHWQYAYDKVFMLYQINIDTYFKRTQILMFAIQGGLIAAFIKLLATGKPNDGYILSEYILYFVLLAVSVLGIVFCFIWLSMIKRQWNTLEHCRCYMRYIEGYLINLGVPLALFRSGAAIFFHHSCVIFGNDKKCENCKSKLCQKRFPYDSKEAKTGLMDLEKYIIFIIRLIWAVCFSIFLYQIQEHCDIMIIYTTILSELLLSFYLAVCIIYTIYEWVKKDKKAKGKNNQFILFWNLKEDLDKCPEKDN